MGRRLFQSFQQRVETVSTEHVHLIDKVHLEASPCRCILNVIQQLLGIFETGSTGSIDLNQINKTTFIDLLAGRALTTGFGGDAGFAVEAFGQNPGNGGLADPAGSGKKIGMVEPVLIEGIHQRLQNMNLPHQLFKVPGAPFPRKHLITHRLFATIPFTAQRRKTRSYANRVGVLMHEGNTADRSQAAASRVEQIAQNYTYSPKLNTLWIQALAVWCGVHENNPAGTGDVLM